jgi:hypothetical protein
MFRQLLVLLLLSIAIGTHAQIVYPSVQVPIETTYGYYYQPIGLIPTADSLLTGDSQSTSVDAKEGIPWKYCYRDATDISSIAIELGDEHAVTELIQEEDPDDGCIDVYVTCDAQCTFSLEFSWTSSSTGAKMSFVFKAGIKMHRIIAEAAIANPPSMFCQYGCTTIVDAVAWTQYLGFTQLNVEVFPFCAETASCAGQVKLPSNTLALMRGSNPLQGMQDHSLTWEDPAPLSASEETGRGRRYRITQPGQYYITVLNNLTHPSSMNVEPLTNVAVSNYTAALRESTSSSSSSSGDGLTLKLEVAVDLSWSDEVVRIVLLVAWSLTLFLLVTGTVGVIALGGALFFPALPWNSTPTPKTSLASQSFLLDEGPGASDDNFFGLNNATSITKPNDSLDMLHKSLATGLNEALYRQISQWRLTMVLTAIFWIPLFMVFGLLCYVLSTHMPLILVFIFFVPLILIQAMAAILGSYYLKPWLDYTSLLAALICFFAFLLLTFVGPASIMLHIIVRYLYISTDFSASTWVFYAVLFIFATLVLAAATAAEAFWVFIAMKWKMQKSQWLEFMEIVPAKILQIYATGFDSNPGAMSEAGVQGEQYEKFLLAQNRLAYAAIALGGAILVEVVACILSVFLTVPVAVTLWALAHMWFGSMGGKDGDKFFRRAPVLGVISAFVQGAFALVVLLVSLWATWVTVLDVAEHFHYLPIVLLHMIFILPAVWVCTLLSLFALIAAPHGDVAAKEIRYIDEAKENAGPLEAENRRPKRFSSSAEAKVVSFDQFDQL